MINQRKKELNKIITQEKNKSSYLAIISIITLLAAVSFIGASPGLAIICGIITTISYLCLDSVQDQKKLDKVYHELRELDGYD
jgi:hypothetical protein